MNKNKDQFTIGTRVRHAVDGKCNEGVVVWKHSDYGGVIEGMRDKIWSVHWSNGQRGIYKTDEINRIPPKNVIKLVNEQINQEEDTQDAEE